MNLKLCKCDELDSLIRGLLFTVASNKNECYFWSQCTEDEQCSTQEYTFQQNKYPFIVSIEKKPLICICYDNQLTYKFVLYKFINFC